MIRIQTLSDTVVDLSANAVVEEPSTAIVETISDESRGILTREDSLDDIQSPGVRSYTSNSLPENSPYNKGGMVVTFSSLLDKDTLYQFYSSDDGSKSAHRTCIKGEWSRWEYSRNKTDSFQGKTVSIMGDSISTFKGYVPEGPGYRWYYTEGRDGVETVDQTWWKRLIDQTGMTLCVNNSVSSSYCSTGVKSGVLASASDERIEGLTAEDGTKPDVIIVFMGTNDYGRGVITGRWNRDTASNPDRVESSSFSGAYAVMIDKIKTLYPQAKVYCCTIPYSSRTSSHIRPSDINPAGVTRSEWNDIIRRIASYYECEVIEFEHCGIDAENLPFYSGDDAVDDDGIEEEGKTGRGLHPNARGHELLYLEALKHFMPEK